MLAVRMHYGDKSRIRGGKVRRRKMEKIEMKNEKTLNQIIQESAKSDAWQADERFTVFAQPDKEFYLAQKAFFVHKYQVLRAIYKHLKPMSVVELGVCAGSGVNAMLSVLGNDVVYHGYDQWEHLMPSEVNGVLTYWDRYGKVQEIFEAYGFENFNLVRTNTRDIESLPQVEFVYVDAAHDYRNCYRDCLLAIGANPKWIYVDDMVGPDVKLATEDFCKDYKDRIATIDMIDQVSGGCLITLK